MKPRMWIPNPQLEEASHFLRSVLASAIASGDWPSAWPLASVLFDLDGDDLPPRAFRELLSDVSDPARTLQKIERWAEQTAKPAENAHPVELVMPSATRLHQWLTTKVRAFREFDDILTEDPVALLALARGADIALAVKAYRGRADSLPPPLVIYGPTGVGKELLARALHAISNHAPSTFGPLNCGGLPPELIESELFGHTAGAFTGADTKRPGIIETHRLGTVFLDEIGDTPPQVQVRLLRFLNDGEIRPVGADMPKRVSPWVVCATHRDLLHLVRQGAFREDLLFRLLGHVVELPPLAARSSDVLPVLKQCLARHAGRPLELHLAEPARVALQTYTWPGNLRELSQLAATLVGALAGAARTIVVELGMLPPLIRQHYFLTRPAAEQIVDLYIQRAPQAEDPEATLRGSLVELFSTGLRSGNHPELRFALLVERIVGSPLFAAMAGGRVALQAHSLAHHRREQAVRRMSDSLLQRLARIDGHPISGLPEIVSEPPSDEGLPSWVRHLLTLGEEVSLGNSNFMHAVRVLVGQIEALSPMARSAVESLISAAIEDIKATATNIDMDGAAEEHAERPHHGWEDVRRDRVRFAQYLKLYGTAVAMGKAFGVTDRTVRDAAGRLGVELPRGRARPPSGSNRKTTGRRVRPPRPRNT